MAKTLFLSHSGADHYFVKKLGRKLQRFRFKVWLDEWEIKVGDSIISKIEQGISSNDFLAIVISPDSLKSAWVKKELNIALFRELDERKVTVLPILYKDCEFPAILRDKKFADFRDDFDSGFSELLKSIDPEIFDRINKGVGNIVGIDFGTSNSSLAILVGDTPQIIPNQEGFKSTPSVVAKTENGDWLVGLPAAIYGESASGATFFSIKRKLGTDFTYSVNGKALKAFQIAGRLFSKFREDCEVFLGKRVTQAILTCPAHFSIRERIDLLEAAKLGGFDVVRLVAEPTAAVVAYEYFEPSYDTHSLVYDLGGGSIDVSIASASDGVILVHSVWGNTKLGGEDFDERIILFCLESLQKYKPSYVDESTATRRRIKIEVEKAKIILSSADSTYIRVPYVGRMENGTPLHLDIEFTRDLFYQLTNDLIENSIECCRSALADFSMPLESIGSLNRLTKNSKSAIKLLDEIQKASRPELIEEGKSRIEKIILCGLPTRMPFVRKALSEFFGKPAICKMDPDDVVAFGAAIQGGVLEGLLRDTLLLDCIPMSIGVELTDGHFFPILHRNTTIPLRKKVVFNVLDSETNGTVIKLFQGEHHNCLHNVWLGTFQIPGKHTQVENIKCDITIDIDANSGIHVIAEINGLEKIFPINSSTIHNYSLKNIKSNLINPETIA